MNTEKPKDAETPKGAASELSAGLGVCGKCRFRDAEGYCISDKLSENYYQKDDEKKDMLIYSYDEGGAFWVGENFGCIHFTPNVELTGAKRPVE